MVAVSIAQRERAALVETLREAGPDASTLCDGWTTRDLTAHLVLRERRLDATPGILVRPLAAYTARVQRQIAESTDWDELVAKVAKGPPVFSPFKLLDALVNVTEMFIHHEDVRRAAADWQPRSLDEPTTAALRRPLPLMARLTMARGPARVTLRTPDGVSLATVGSGAPVEIIADPGELLLFVFGRDAVHAEFTGDAAAVAAVKSAPRGL